MIKVVGEYILDKTTKTIVGKVIKWGFWSGVFFFGPVSIIATVGVEGLVAGAVLVHSGIIEYGTSKAISKVL